MPKVMVEVEEGSRAWAIAVCAKGASVVHPDLPMPYYRTHTAWKFDGSKYATGWKLYVEPPQPITAQPGTSPWAMEMVRRGGTVRRASRPSAFFSGDGRQSGFSMTPEYVQATDWEVVP